jgi:hypothetical protein
LAATGQSERGRFPGEAPSLRFGFSFNGTTSFKLSSLPALLATVPAKDYPVFTALKAVDSILYFPKGEQVL